MITEWPKSVISAVQSEPHAAADPLKVFGNQEKWVDRTLQPIVVQETSGQEQCPPGC